MTAVLKSPSKVIDVYSNFISLFTLQQGPQDSVDTFVSQIRQFGSSLAAGGMPLDPRILSMVFMLGLDDRFDILKRDFVLNAEKYVGLSLDALQQETIRFTSNLKNLMDEEVTPT